MFNQLSAMGLNPKTILTGLGLLTGLTVFAQQRDSLNHTQETTHLAPIEIEGIRVKNHAPYAVSNLDSAAIKESSNVQDIPYLLNQTPSVNITSDAGAGVGYTGIHIRGTDASRINFTMNGIPINDAESQAAIFVDFPDILNSTSSIQIQRGVGSSTNGAGAFGASVNMYNIKQSKKAYATFNSAVGSFNTFKNTIKAGTGLLKNGFQFDVRLSKITSDGYIDRAFSNLKSFQFIAGWTSKNDKTSIKFNLLTGKEKTGQAWNGVPEDSLKTNRRYNGLGLMENGKYYANQTDNYQQDYYQLFLNHQFNSYLDAHIGLFLTRGKGYYNEYRLNDAFSDYYRPPFITPKGDSFTTTNLTRQLWLDNYFYGATYSLNYQKSKTQLNLGGNVNFYDGKHYGFVTWADYGFPNNYRWYNLTAYKNSYSVYLKWRQQFSYNFYLFADLQYRHIDYTMNGFRHHPEIRAEVHYNFLNPKVGLSYEITHPNNSSSKISISLAEANKEPNRDDYEASTDDLPSPEKLYDIELAYKYIAPHWQMGLNAYYMYYHNQLILTGKINDVGTYTRQNVPVSYRRGLEWTANYNPVPFFTLTANASFSQNKIKEYHQYIDNYDNGTQKEATFTATDIAFSPNIIAFVKATFKPFANHWKNQSFAFDIMGKHVSRQYLDNTGNMDRGINPYTLVNLRFRYALTTKNFIKSVGLTLSLNNVFNKMYVSNGYTFSYISAGHLQTQNYYFPQAGFNFILGLRIKF